MFRKVCYITFFVGFTLFFNSCKVFYSNVMLQTPKDFKYNEIKKNLPSEFKITVHDILSFKLLSNDGFKAVDLNSYMGSENGIEKGGGLSFIVEIDGTIKLPVIGKTKVEGMTPREAELFLEEKFSEFYIKPFVVLKVTNRRVILFPGTDGAAKIVPISNTSTTLLELIAGSGGIPVTGKAFSIKVIRGNLDNPEVFLVDFSTLEGVKKGNMIMQSNDIVYIDTRPRIARNLSQEIVPYFALVNTLIVAFTLYKNFSK